MKKTKIKLKKKTKIVLYIILAVFIICGILIGSYFYIRSSLIKIGYSEKATTNIIKMFKFTYVDDYPNNKTLNAVFESKSLIEENLDRYAKIDYHNQENFVNNINTFIKKGYTDKEINLIIARGDDESVSEFAKRDKVNNLDKLLKFKYSKLEKYDEYLSYMNKNLSDEKDAIISVNLLLDKKDYTDFITINGYSELMLVNKHHFLGKAYIPENLVSVKKEYTLNGGDASGSKVAVEAAINMIDAAKKDGFNLLINSGYRSYKEQEEVYNTYLSLYGEKYCVKYVLKPGYSEHQTGLAFDFASGTSGIFKNSKEYEWIKKHASEYGFIYRFSFEKEDITGINHEAWHYRYVGIDVAKAITENKLSLEEYYTMYVDI